MSGAINLSALSWRERLRILRDKKKSDAGEYWDLIVQASTSQALEALIDDLKIDRLTLKFSSYIRLRSLARNRLVLVFKAEQERKEKQLQGAT